MSLDSIRERAAEALAAALETAFGHRPDEVMFEVPPKRELGDLAWPGALPLAKELKTAPRQIAEKINEAAKWPEEIMRVEIAGPGFLNLYLDRNLVLAGLLSGEDDERTSTDHKNDRRAHGDQPQQGRAHRSPPQLGARRHPRAAACVTSVRRWRSRTTSTTPGCRWRTSWWGSCICPRPSSRSASESNPADATNWSTWWSSDCPARTSRRPRRRTSTISAGRSTPGSPTVTPTIRPSPNIGPMSSTGSRRASGELDLEQSLHLLEDRWSRARNSAAERWLPRGGRGRRQRALPPATMARLGITYDLLTHESDILHLGFWQRAFEILNRQAPSGSRTTARTPAAG